MVIIIIIDDSNDDNIKDVEDEKLSGEEWMYDEDINSGIY